MKACADIAAQPEWGQDSFQAVSKGKQQVYLSAELCIEPLAHEWCIAV